MKEESVLSAILSMRNVIYELKNTNDIFMGLSDNNILNTELYFKNAGISITYTELLDMKEKMEKAVKELQDHVSKGMDDTNRWDTIDPSAFSVDIIDNKKAKVWIKDFISPLLPHLPYGKIYVMAVPLHRDISYSDWLEPLSDVKRSAISGVVAALIEGLDTEVLVSLDYTNFKPLYRDALMYMDDNRPHNPRKFDIVQSLNSDPKCKKWLADILGVYVTILMVYHINNTR